MNDMTFRIDRAHPINAKSKSRRRLAVVVPTVAVLLGAASYAYFQYQNGQSAVAAPAAALANVTVAQPLRQNVDQRGNFIGQFSAIDRVELRAQVGGTLSEIHFKDGQIVKKGELLFAIDPRPYEIKLAQAKAELATGHARLALANNQLARAQSLVKDQWTSVATLDQRVADKAAALAAVDDASAKVRDAQLDLDYSRITAPFTGRIGARDVSVGSLIAGSRAGTGPSTLLATLVSIDPIYVNFDMSESDYLAFARERQKENGPLANKVSVALADETTSSRTATLDFLNNTLDRASGTMHARATVPNSDALLLPGSFARVDVSLSKPVPAFLVPDAAVLPDQSEHIVLTVNADNVVTPKRVTLGDLRDGLRVVRSGLEASDKIIIEGIPTARPGSKVAVTSKPLAVAANESGN